MATTDEIVELTQKLISFEGTHQNRKKLDESIKYVHEYAKRNKLKIKKYAKNGYSSLILSNYSSDKPADLILHGHIDVVPGEREQFKSYIKSNRLYGRGALDMKGGLATLLVFLKNHAKSDKKLMLLVTSDEEIGGSNGTEYLMKEGNVNGKFFITAEGEKEYKLKYQQKGVVMARVKSQGKGEHSAYTWVGDNAINKLMDALRELGKLFPASQDPEHWYSTMNVGKISGGTATNSIPDYAEADIDIRFCPPWKNQQQVINKITSTIKKFRGVSCEILYQTAVMKTKPDNPLLQRLHSITQQVVKSNKDLYFKNHGTNDARFAADKGIPSVGFGPIGNNYHAKDEYVNIKSLHDYYLIIEKFLVTL